MVEFTPVASIQARGGSPAGRPEIPNDSRSYYRPIGGESGVGNSGPRKTALRPRRPVCYDWNMSAEPAQCLDPESEHVEFVGEVGRQRHERVAVDEVRVQRGECRPASGRKHEARGRSRPRLQIAEHEISERLGHARREVGDAPDVRAEWPVSKEKHFRICRRSTRASRRRSSLARQFESLVPIPGW